MDSNCHKWNIIPVPLNLKPKELPPTDNHYTDLVGKVNTYGQETLLLGDRLLTEPGARPQVSMV
jgi:hypothetical protein